MSGQFLNTSSVSRTVMPSQTSNTGYSSSFSFSIPNAAVSDHDEKSIPSHPRTSTAAHPPPSTLPLSSSHTSQNNPHQLQRTEVSHIGNVSLSSGYGSPSPFQHFTPSTESGTDTTQSLKHDDVSTTKVLTKTGQTSFTSSNWSASVSGKSQPKELFKPGGADCHGDVLYCSNCKKQFKYGRQAFDSWFEHVRFCDK